MPSTLVSFGQANTCRQSKAKGILDTGEYGGGQHSAASAGHRKKTTHTFASLPFDHCALSLKPFELPVCNPQGICYDLWGTLRLTTLLGHNDDCACLKQT